MHLTIVHFLNQLRLHFIQQLSNGAGGCKKCSRKVKTEHWALHAGVVHGVAVVYKDEEIRKKEASYATATSSVSSSSSAHTPAPTSSGQTSSPGSPRTSVITCTPVQGQGSAALQSATFESNAQGPSTSPGPKKSGKVFVLNMRKNKEVCKLAFDSVEGLMKHLQGKAHAHAQADVACSCCNFAEKVGAPSDLERRLSLHLVSKAHLYNRWLAQLPDPHRQFCPDRREVDPLFTDVCEPCGGERVSDLPSHAATQMHRDNAGVVADFEAHCDLREVCPVTCSARDVCFYMDYYASSGGGSAKGVRTNRLVNVVSRMHDRVDGQELLAVPEVEDKVSELLSTRMGERKRRFRYICYSCPFAAADADEMESHVGKPGHVNAARYRKGQQLKNVVRCVPCATLFRDPEAFRLHRYDREHLSNVFDDDNNYDNNNPAPGSVVETLLSTCSLCKVANITERRDHVESDGHRKLEGLARKYLEHCAQKNIHPVRCGVEEVRAYLKEAARSEKREGNSTAFAHDLSAVSAIHEAIESREDVVGRETSSASQSSPATTRSERAGGGGSPYSPVLSARELYSVTRCPSCHQTFDHATYLVLHLRKVHGVPPSTFVGGGIRRDRRRLNCCFCTRSCASPLAFALHHDRHQVKRLVTCGTCGKAHASPYAFYTKDFCGRNNIDASIKEEAKAAIALLALRTHRGVIGDGSDDEDDEGEEKEKGGGKEEESKEKGKEKSKESKKGERNEKHELLRRSRNWSDPDDKFLPEKEESNEEGQESKSKSARAELLPLCKVDITAQEKLVADEYIKKERRVEEEERVEAAPDAAMAERIKPPPLPAALKRRRSERSTSEASSGVASKGNKRRRTSPADPDAASYSNKFVKHEGGKEECGANKARADGRRNSSPPPPSPSPTPGSSKSTGGKSRPFPPSSSPSSPRLTAMDNFCLDCEHCPGTSCKHEDHPRVALFGGPCAVGAHMRATKHRRFQPAASFLRLSAGVRLEDLAYSGRYGNRVRKTFKAGVIAGQLEAPRQLGRPRRCRVPGCHFETDKVLDIFRHIREKHLNVAKE